MGVLTIPTPAGVSRNIVALTSTQTWTVPSTAQYVDVLVIGGGGGGFGGNRSAGFGAHYNGCGGGVLFLQDVYLGGTGTVSVTIGAGGAGSAGQANTSTVDAGVGTFSAFGTYGYAGGAYFAPGNSPEPGIPGYKGTTVNPLSGTDTTQSNFAPALIGLHILKTSDYVTDNNGAANPYGPSIYFGVNAFGLSGGRQGNIGTGVAVYSGSAPGTTSSGTANNISQTRTVIPNYFWRIDNYLGSASAGGNSSSGSVGGAAGVKGFAGSGGGTRGISNGAGAQGGPGAGGGGACPTAGGTGGAGGNAGSNTGAGGGGGGTSFSATAGTGGNGGNGGSGLVMVSWIG